MSAIVPSRFRRLHRAAWLTNGALLLASAALPWADCLGQPFRPVAALAHPHFEPYFGTPLALAFVAIVTSIAFEATRRRRVRPRQSLFVIALPAVLHATLLAFQRDLWPPRSDGVFDMLGAIGCWTGRSRTVVQALLLAPVFAVAAIAWIRSDENAVATVNRMFGGLAAMSAVLVWRAYELHWGAIVGAALATTWLVSAPWANDERGERPLRAAIASAAMLLWAALFWAVRPNAI